MGQTRRSLLSAIGAVLPLGASPLTVRAEDVAVPAIRFRTFEDAVRSAFAAGAPDSLSGAGSGRESSPCRRIEVGYSDLIRAGVQGCHNEGPFAGFPAGHLKIVRSTMDPGPLRRGVRLCVSAVDVVWTGGTRSGLPTRPLDFATLPPAPILV